MKTDAKILVVDDDRLILGATRQTLEAAGYETLGAQDGEQALQMVRLHRPELMLLDVNMPKMDGFEVCRRIKADPALVGTFVIMVSGTLTDSDSRIEGLEKGADGYITRPIGNRELLARVQAMLRIQKAEIALRQSEQVNHNSEEKFRGVVEQSSDGIVIANGYGIVIEWNPKQVEITGLEKNEVLGKPIWDAQFKIALPEEQTPYLYDQLKDRTSQIFSSKQSEYFGKLIERKICSKGGTIRTVETVMYSIQLDNDFLVSSVMHDITRRKQEEDEIRQMNFNLETRVDERTRQLQDVQEKLVRQEKLAVLGQLAGGVGHELRNPLGVINNAIYFLRLIQPEADKKVKEYLGIIENETHNADKIIKDLLEYSSSKSVDQERVLVTDIFTQALERFPTPEDVNISRKLTNVLLTVKVDMGQMIQVLSNLILNAYQAMQGGGKLTLSAVQKGEEIIISVKDTGPGISTENMAKLFEPLFTTKPKGIGLGLAVSRKLVEANNGHIEVRSQLGKAALSKSICLFTRMVMNSNFNILIVDDDEHMTQTISDIFTQTGYGNAIANSAKQALEIAQKSHIDCILSDIQMPDMNGVDLFQQIHSLKPGIPFVLISANASENLVRQGLESGVAAILEKPLDMRSLLGFISSMQSSCIMIIVDNDPATGQNLADILEKRGYSLLKISDPGADVNILAAQEHIVLLNMNRNRLDDIDVFNQLRARHADFPFIFVTSRPQIIDAFIQDELEIKAKTWVFKPEEIDNLLENLETICLSQLRRKLAENK